MIQDIGKCHFNNNYQYCNSEQQDYCLSFADDRVFARYNKDKKSLHFPHCKFADRESIYLFSVEKKSIF